MAASLLLHLVGELRDGHQVSRVSVDLLRKIQKVPKSQLKTCIAREQSL